MKNNTLNTRNAVTNAAEVQTFTFMNIPVRGVFIEGKPWFVARDAADVLEYKDTVNAIKLHCRGMAKYHPLATPGGVQEMRIIGEPDVYRLINNSKMPKAQEFEAWFYEEVLPQIRKTGSYGAAQGPSLEAVNKFFEENVPRVKGLVSENAWLRQMNRLYEEKEQLRQQLARKNTPVSEGEKQRILAYATQWSVAEIARFTGRSESAVRNVVKKGDRGVLRQTLSYPSLEAQIAASRGKEGGAV